jgi:hypothetical protein
MIEENMKRLWTSPASIKPSDPVLLLGNVTWIIGDDALMKFMKVSPIRLLLFQNIKYRSQDAFPAFFYYSRNMLSSKISIMVRRWQK